MILAADRGRIGGTPGTGWGRRLGRGCGHRFHRRGAARRGDRGGCGRSLGEIGDVLGENAATPSASSTPTVAATVSSIVWAADAEKELTKIPYFVRGKARRNTEKFAAERGVALITVETLYDAKAHFGR